MLKILGFLIDLPSELAFLANPVPSFIINMAAWIVIAIFINLIFVRILKLITRRIPGDLEDILLGILNQPIIDPDWIVWSELFAQTTSIDGER